MFDILKKSVLTGIGVMWMSKEKIEAEVKKLIEEAKVSKEEGEKILDSVLKKAEDAKKEFENQIEIYVKKAVDKIGIATKEDFKKLEERVSAIEKTN